MTWLNVVAAILLIVGYLYVLWWGKIVNDKLNQAEAAEKAARIERKRTQDIWERTQDERTRDVVDGYWGRGNQ